jgi:hypothetical protein
MPTYEQQILDGLITSIRAKLVVHGIPMEKRSALIPKFIAHISRSLVDAAWEEVRLDIPPCFFTKKKNDGE